MLGVGIGFIIVKQIKIKLRILAARNQAFSNLIPPPAPARREAFCKTATHKIFSLNNSTKNKWKKGRESFLFNWSVIDFSHHKHPWAEILKYISWSVPPSSQLRNYQHFLEL